MMNFFLILIIVLFVSCTEDSNEEYPIRFGNVELDNKFISEFKYLDIDNIPDTVKFNVNHYEFIYNVESLKGKMSFIVSDSTGVRLRGQYSESLGVLGYYWSSFDMDTGDEMVELVNYYEPIKEGEWVYLINNKVVKKENYYRGGLVMPQIR